MNEPISAPGTLPRDPMVPSLALDPFDDAFLLDPYARHSELRDAGPVVWLEHYGIFAMARFEQV